MDVNMGKTYINKFLYKFNLFFRILGKDKLKREYIFLATGSKPRKLNIPGEEYIATSEEFMETENLPERIIFIGCGHISLEFTHVARRTGAEVTILHRSERLLRHHDADMVNLLVKATETAEIRILMNKPAASIEKEDNGFLVKPGSKSGTESETENFRDRSNLNTTRIAGTEFEASKVIIDEANDRIIEACILGQNARETINVFAAVSGLDSRHQTLKN
jgi:glutathione reductase (NADPH)